MIYMSQYYDDDEMADLRREFAPRRKPRGCCDRMCGAEDCPTCHPENFDTAGNYLPDIDEE